MVYYLRTTSRDYRQPWLDTIQESVRLYQKSVQKAGVGVMPGTALIPQQSVPSVITSTLDVANRTDVIKVLFYLSIRQFEIGSIILNAHMDFLL